MCGKPRAADEPTWNPEGGIRRDFNRDFDPARSRDSPDDPLRQSVSPNMRARATRAQRIGAVIALLVAVWLALQLFASVLAAVRCGRGHRLRAGSADLAADGLGMPRSGAALLMILAVIAVVLVFALLLYPLILLRSACW